MGNVMMLILGITLFGSTVLLPLYMQTLMGYTAQLAGMALSPGGIAVILCLPIVGKLSGTADVRFLIAFGFAVLSASLWYMTRHLYVGIDFRHAMLLRIYQSIGMAFLFVPINLMATLGLPREKGNAASGMINLFRNMGGDIGIAMVTTMLARHTQMHQNVLVRNAVATNPQWISRLAGTINGLVQRTGLPPLGAQREAMAMLYRSLVSQAAALAYLDVLRVMAIFTMVMVPFVFVVKKVKASGGPAMAH
jgi:DHA2 family multidrug resistance protein